MSFRNYFATIILLVGLLPTLKAQTMGCGFDRLMQDSSYIKKMDKLNPRIAEIVTQREGLRVAATSSAPSTIYTLPVVFHVMHYAGTPLGTAENIPDVMVLQMLSQLNEQFRKTPGSMGDGDGVDTGIEFCLASIDTNGKPTTGIEHINASGIAGYDTYGVGNEASLGYYNNTNDLKALSTWDSSKYINIWIVANIDSGKGNEAGFAGVGLGIVALYNGNSQTITHEMGHTLSLFHTFQGGCGETDCSTQGDLVCDTPPTTSDATVGGNTCTPVTPYPCGVRPLIENYMDYTLFLCKNMFTQGQADRMVASILASYPTMYQSANLTATGCNSNVPPQAFFTVKDSITAVCTSDTISFMDLSTRKPTSWNWTFENGTPATSTGQNPKVVFNSSGKNVVTLVVSNSNNGKDSLSTYSDTIFVSAAANPVVAGATGAYGSQISLSASGTGTIYWYDSAGNFIQTGNQYTTPILTKTTTYYAQDVEQGPRMQAGMAYKNLGNTFHLDSTGYLAFSVYKSIILDSVSIVNMDASNPILIGLRDKYNNLLDTALIINAPLYTLATIPLNFHIRPDTGYILTLEPYNGLRGHLADNVIGAGDPTYPFLLPGFLNIYQAELVHSLYSDSNYTDDSYITGGNKYFPYFFSWVVREDICPSEKVPVVATIEQTTGVAASVSGNGFNVYPNPANTSATAVFNNENGQIELSDANGRTISSQPFAGGAATLNLEGVPTGIYFIHLTTQSGSYYSKLIKN